MPATRDARPRPARRARLLASSAALVALAFAAPARAGGFWSETLDSSHGAEDFERAMHSGDSLAERAASHSMHNTRLARRLAHDAIAAYQRAIEADEERADPERGIAHYRAAELLYAHFIRDDEEPDRELCERAIAHWSRFEQLAPLHPRIPDALIHRSLTHTKLIDKAHLERALDDYRSLLQLIDGSSASAEEMATWLYNQAEILMMLGRTGKAIELYARSLGYLDRPLYAYGMAVALDRDGQIVKAREVIRAYATTDRLRDLRKSGVFFVPRGEKHYYLGLGYEALDDPERALRHFERYLDSGAHPQFHDRAREHVRALERRLREEGRERD